MLNESLKYEISAISNIHIVAILISLVFLIIFFTKIKRDWSLYSFVVMQASLIFWMFFKILKTVSPNIVLRWSFVLAYYFCVYVFEVAIFNFNYSLYKNKKPRRDENIALIIMAFLQFMIVSTNPIHHKFYSRFDMKGDAFGYIFYVSQFIIYLIIGVSVYYGVLHFRKRLRGVSKAYMAIMASIIAVPLVLNLLYITHIWHKFIWYIGVDLLFDITPMSFIFSTVVFYYVTFDRGLLEVSPIKRYEIVNNLDSAICFLGSSFRNIYSNEKFFNLLGESGVQIVESEVIELNPRGNVGFEKEFSLEGKTFRLKGMRVETFAETQYLITIDDISDYLEIKNKLAIQNSRLDAINAELKLAITQLEKASKEGARNYVAKELHDIIGHSLVVVIKLMEVAKMYAKKDEKLCLKALEDSSLALNEGIDKMAHIREHEERYNTNMLQEELRKMLSRIESSEIKVHFNYKGVNKDVQAKIYDSVLRVCRELVTNAIKHASPTAIFIALSCSGERISISVMDNGIGCDNLVEGNGLNGIKERIASCKGLVEFICGEGEGFMAKLEVPV